MSIDGDIISEIMNYICIFGFNINLLNILCGQLDFLFVGILNLEEKCVFIGMV